MPFGLGFFATAGVSAAAGSFDLLETQVLGSSAASVTFSSLSTYASTYKHLQVRYTIRATRDATALDWYYIQFNSDSGTNYNSHYLLGNGSSASSGQEYTSYPNGIVSTAPAVNSTGFKGAVLDVLDPFETTKFTTTRMLGGYNGGAVNRVTLTSGLWRNTAAVSAITIVPVNSELAANSRFSLYGIKGA